MRHESTHLDRLIRHSWHPVAVAAELDDAPMGVTLLDQPVVLVRSGAGVRAYTDVCVHRGAALSLGWREDDGCIRCPFHGWKYEPNSGQVVEIPRPLGPTREYFATRRTDSQSSQADRSPLH